MFKLFAEISSAVAVAISGVPADKYDGSEYLRGFIEQSCGQTQKAARVAMGLRQSGSELKKELQDISNLRIENDADNRDVALLFDLVLAAYRYPVKGSASEQKKLIKDFSDDQYLKCITGEKN